MKKRALSIMIVAVMILTLIPAVALIPAADGPPHSRGALGNG